MSKRINVILSGGSGTRLWPLSRQSQPKQFLRIFNRKSLFQATLERNLKLVDSFTLVTNAFQANLAIEQAHELDISIESKIVEPIGRNTAAAIAYAAFKADPEDILFVTPSDHMIETGELYNESLEKAFQLASKGSLVTFGIRPSYPEVGFGYIEFEGENVLCFREKPDLETAIKFVECGQFLWNSGMFCFKAGVFLKELELYQPDIFNKAKKAFASMNAQGEMDLSLVQQIPDLSIDYAVMEKSNLIKVVSATFDWTDLGSFNALIDYHNVKEKVSNLCKIEGTVNGYAFTKKKVFGHGFDNHVLVETDDCILILPLDQSGKIKDIYNQVKINNKELIV